MIDLSIQVDRLEKFSVFVALSAAVFIIYLLSIDFNIIPYESSRDYTNDKTLATISEKVNTVKKRPSTLPVWEDVTSSETLYEREQIYTASKSSAKLKFDDGTILDIGENSLIVLQKALGILSVELLKGEVYGSTSNKKGFEIVAKKVKAIMKSNSKVKINIQNERPVMNIIEGSAGVQVEESTIIEMKKNQTGTLEAGGKLKIQDILVELLSPDQGQSSYISKSKKIKFTWKSAFLKENDVENINLEISQSQDFSSILKSVKQDGTSEQLELVFDKAGTYFWRIKAFSKVKSASVYSIARSFVLIPDDPPVLIRPYDREELSYKDKEKTVVLFDWEKLERVDSYSFVLSSKSDLSSPIITKSVSEPPLSLQISTPGTYYWGVKNISTQRDSLLSTVRMFTIADIKLYFPIETESVYIPNGKDEMALRWSSIASAKTYLLEISKDRNFSNIILSSRHSNNSYNWLAASIGRFYWRIKVYDSKDNLITTSASKNFIITRDKPKTPIIKSKYKFQIKVK